MLSGPGRIKKRRLNLFHILRPCSRLSLCLYLIEHTDSNRAGRTETLTTKLLRQQIQYAKSIHQINSRVSSSANRQENTTKDKTRNGGMQQQMFLIMLEKDQDIK